MNPFIALVKVQRGVSSHVRNRWLRLLGVRLTGYVWLRRVSVPRQWGDITLEGGASLDDGVVLICSGPAKADKLIVRRGTYINRNTVIDAHDHVEVGYNCMVGPACYVTDGDHGTAHEERVNAQPIKTSPVVIEDDVWLGAGVIVLKGVHIGRGAVVGAGAVVTRDVAPYAKVAGVPARMIGQRVPVTRAGLTA